MSYSLAVWEGPRPMSDKAGKVEFDRLVDAWEEQDAPPTPRIEAFVNGLLVIWPDGDGASPWVFDPLRDACGPIVFLGIRFDEAGAASPVIAGAARRRGLVCFDPQVGTLL